MLKKGRMSGVNVYFGLGSNQGDRLGNIRSAVRLLDEALGVHYTALSRIIETESWGFSGQNFLNACILYRIGREGSPEAHGEALLDVCKAVERELGRDDVPEFDSDGRRIYHDRTMDIDILFYGSERIETPRLTVPHPLIRQRPFVMEPLLEIARPSLRRKFPEIFGENVGFLS